jgi:hypothetical protein
MIKPLSRIREANIMIPALISSFNDAKVPPG